MRTLIKIGLGMLLLAVALVGAAFGVLRAQDSSDGAYVNEIDDTNGNRALKSEIRTVSGDVVVVDLNGPIDLTLKQGPVAAMAVRAEERLLPRIVTTQDGNTLHIDLKPVLVHISMYTDIQQPVQLELTLPALQQLTVHGSGDSTVAGFSGDKLMLVMHGSGDIHFNGQYQHVGASLLGSGDLQLALGNGDDLNLDVLGSGDITASGQSKTLTAHMLGSGDLDAGQLHADSVSVDMSGSGDSTVFAKQAAILSVTGSGDLKVLGNPGHRHISKLGSGDIRWEND